MRHPRWC